jgi:Glycosyl transferase family 2
LNRGLRLAEGQLIARQDADDISDPERLGRQIAFFEKHEELVLLGTTYKKIDAEGMSVGIRKLPTMCGDIRWSLLFFCPFVHSSVMLRKLPVLEKVGFYSESFNYAQDYELWSRIARRFPVANLREPLVQYRITPTTMTSTYGAVVQDEISRIRLANVKHILERNNAGRTVGKVTEMMSLLFHSSTFLSLEDATRAVEMINPVSEAFCAYYGITHSDCAVYKADLRFRMARRLRTLAHYCVGQECFILSCRLFLKALPLHWPILLEKDSVAFCSKLVMGRYRTKAAKRFVGP